MLRYLWFITVEQGLLLNTVRLEISSPSISIFNNNLPADEILQDQALIFSYVWFPKQAYLHFGYDSVSVRQIYFVHLDTYRCANVLNSKTFPCNFIVASKKGVHAHLVFITFWHRAQEIFLWPINTEMFSCEGLKQSIAEARAKSNLPVAQTSCRSFCSHHQLHLQQVHAKRLSSSLWIARIGPSTLQQRAIPALASDVNQLRCQSCKAHQSRPTFTARN